MPMTLQETFDFVANHLLTQNKKAVDSYGDCAYRAADGTRCAIGCLIPDDQYRAEFEGFIIGQAYFTEAIAKRNPKNSKLAGRAVITRRLDDTVVAVSPDLDFLEMLQHIHDNSPVTDWPKRLRQLAKEYMLSAAVVDNFTRPVDDQASPAT